MINSISTDNYVVKDSNSVYLWDAQSNLTLHFEINAFKFDLMFVFETNMEKETNELVRSVNEDTIEIKCINFNNPFGSGTFIPIELATIEGKKLYIHFWTFLLGESTKNKTSRKVEYTFLVER